MENKKSYFVSFNMNTNQGTCFGNTNILSVVPLTFDSVRDMEKVIKESFEKEGKYSEIESLAIMNIIELEG